MANSLKDNLPDDERIADIVMAHNEGILEYQTKLSLLPSAQPDLTEEDWKLIKKLRSFHNGTYAKALDKLMLSAQPEQSKASEFWRKRADFYSDMCMNLIGEMGKGVKIESVKISESGIEFVKEQPPEQPERKTGVWFIRKFGSDAKCSICGMRFSDVYDLENSDAYCRHCGLRMEGLKVISGER